MRKFVAESLVLALVFVLSVTVAAANDNEVVGHITRFEDGKMTVKISQGSETPEEVTLKFDDDVKIFRSRFNMDTMKIEAGEAYEGGKEALAEHVKETAAKVRKWTEEGKKGFGPGVFASIITEEDKVLEIRVTGGGKRKDDK